MSLDLYLKPPGEKQQTGIFLSNGMELSREDLCKLLNDNNISMPSYDDTYVEDYHIFNITHNLGEMASHISVLDDPEDLSLTLYDVMWRPGEHMEEIGAKDKVLAENLIPYFEVAKIRMLNKNTKKWLKTHFTPSNGWGSFDNLSECVDKAIKEFDYYPDYEVEVSR